MTREAPLMVRREEVVVSLADEIGAVRMYLPPTLSRRDADRLKAVIELLAEDAASERSGER